MYILTTFVDEHAILLPKVVRVTCARLGLQTKVCHTLEGNQNKNNCLVSNFYNKLKSCAEKSAGNFNLL